MGEQRRRGNRGRSGRGGRIPKKGEGGPPPTMLHDEAFTSFPLEIGAPIQAPGLIDEAAVEAAFRALIAREARQASALRALAEQDADGVLGAMAAEIEGHRSVLERMARDLEAELDCTPAEGDGTPPTGGIESILTEQQLARVGWSAIQAMGGAAGDPRIDRAADGVLRDKERHAEVLHAYAARAVTQTFFRPPEDEV